MDFVEQQGKCYSLVCNIPHSFHSSDLRNYFSVFIESDQFDCFHFRHRPQIISVIKSEAKTEDDAENSLETQKSVSENSEKQFKTLCGLVRFSDESHLSTFIKKYHGKFWVDREGNDLHSKCLISRIKITSDDDIKRFSRELRPPRALPKGNVGTPNSNFLTLISQCKLPPSLIKKLGIQFPKGRRYKKYSNVPYDYNTSTASDKEESEDEEAVTGRGHLITDIPSTKIVPPSTDPDPENSETGEAYEEDDDDKDNCEEWERHEALHNDVTSQERTKERLYEEEIEVVWEKGGPGIVWYTDAQFWHELEEGGFDEQTADDLDVDMEGYYVEGGGDKDARDFMEMRKSARFKQGESSSVFTRRSPSPSTSTGNEQIGQFEKFTRGIGRKVMEKQGWKEGKGLGKSSLGIPDALDNDGKHPRDKGGLGFYGEKLVFGSTKGNKRRLDPFGKNEDGRIVIGTIYDSMDDLDRQEPLLRSNAPLFVKRYRSAKGHE